MTPLPSGFSLRLLISKLAPRRARHTTRPPLVRVWVMADPHRSALRPRGRPRGRHARLIVRCSTREFPVVAMGPLRPVWAARRARWSHAISDALAVSRARIRGGCGGRLIGRCLLFSQVRRERSSGRWVYDEGSARPRHAPSPRAPPSRSTSSRSRPGRSGAIPIMPWSPRAMSNSCVSARLLLAQERKRVSRGGRGGRTAICHSAAVSEAVPQQFRSSSAAAPQQLRSSSAAAPQKLRSCSAVVPCYVLPPPSFRVTSAVVPCYLRSSTDETPASPPPLVGNPVGYARGGRLWLGCVHHHGNGRERESRGANPATDA